MNQEISKLPASDSRPVLGANANDRWAALARAGVGLVPIVGSALVEVVAEIVPNQRVDRIEAYLRALEERIDRLSSDETAENIASEMKRPEKVALIEEGASVSARLISSDRRGHIAQIVAYGLTQEVSGTLTTQRFIFLYGELDDGDIALLISWAEPMGAVWRLHPQRADFPNSDEYHVAEGLHDASVMKLERLGLLQFLPRTGGNSHAPINNRFSGRPEGSHILSPLGRALLNRLELSDLPGESVGNE
ncbi:hypothetical protein [Methylobacterium sp. Leaf106]|uniref:hypothetical protein n=1 Tax=Methylobacterium sp. Leaf106 TaxID=1736255 RepID=UPI000A401318|nr:hypothetical protein [Methylobacterium sp. Leaf106]